MRFLADESCDFAVVKALRKAGHDVKAIAEMSPGISDEEVAMQSAGEMRILIQRTNISDRWYMQNRRRRQVSFLSAFLRMPVCQWLI